MTFVDAIESLLLLHCLPGMFVPIVENIISYNLIYFLNKT